MSLERIIRAIKEPRRIIKYLVLKTAIIYPDKLYLKLLFPLRTGYKLDLKNPKTFNEKLQWLKLYNRNPLYSTMVCKIDVKEYVSRIIGSEYIIPTLGVYNSVEEIDFEQLPKRFVLKCSHDSGGIVVCKNKDELNIEAVKERLRKGLKVNYYYRNREWPYKYVVPRIIAEQYMEDESGYELKDYKVLCFNGKPRLIERHSGRFTDNHTQDFYDINWIKTKITQNGYGLVSNSICPKPEKLEQMLYLSEILAKDLPHVRIDWYICNNLLFFGEITFFDGSGMEPFDRMEDDLLLGSWIDLNLAYSRKQNIND